MRACWQSRSGVLRRLSVFPYWAVCLPRSGLFTRTHWWLVAKDPHPEWHKPRNQWVRFTALLMANKAGWAAGVQASPQQMTPRQWDAADRLAHQLYAGLADRLESLHFFGRQISGPGSPSHPTFN